MPTLDKDSNILQLYYNLPQDARHLAHQFADLVASQRPAGEQECEALLKLLRLISQSKQPASYRINNIRLIVNSISLKGQKNAD